MNIHHEQTPSPYSPEQLFDLVIDIEHYPDFLPWCSAARITERTGKDQLLADLVIRFKAFQEKYTSRVLSHRPTPEEPDGYIIVELVDGPFAHLKNVWKFIEQEKGTTIDFHIEFQFKNKLLDKMVGFMFERAQRKVVDAFQTRAEALYGGKFLMRAQ
ncbi:MAG: ubiquinone-binding protein [Rickettsiales bacterium]|nr:ubiquinone-binding protein [Rickettsiales bacterium]